MKFPPKSPKIKSSSKHVHVRFAPSPGALHVGNALCALGNAVFAKKHDGHFLLRVDDTASLPEASEEEPIGDKFLEGFEEDLVWLGIGIDQCIQQSQRMEFYQEAAELLKKGGFLYPCYETEEELQAYREDCERKKRPPIYRKTLSWKTKVVHPYWRFALSGKTVAFDDAIQGACHSRTSSLSDPVLLRANGSPTYTLASVVDDGACAITHIIRGRDHLTNTGMHIEMMEALEMDLPIFAHHGLLGEGDQMVLSKRQASQSLANLREDGMLGSALRQAITQPSGLKASQEQSLMPSFLRRHNTLFDSKTLWAINRDHIRRLSLAEVNALCKPKKIILTQEFWLMIKDNISTFDDVVSLFRSIDPPQEQPESHLTEDLKEKIRKSISKKNENP